MLINHCKHDSESHDVYYWYIKKAKVHELDTNVETKDTIRKLVLFIGIC